MKSTLNGRLRNTNLPGNKGLLPVYEAVVNSIEAIEERNLTERKELSEYSITLKIDRAAQLDLETGSGSRPEGEIKGFTISDDGAGFNDGNWESFNTLDSLRKANKGCRGIGRLMWLKAFDKVKIRSAYEEDGKTKRRAFMFDVQNEVSDKPFGPDAIDGTGTVIELRGFRQKFAKATHKTLDRIASGLLEHCLWYYIRDQGVPRITVLDGGDATELSDLFDAHMHGSSSRETIEVKDRNFEITHVKVRADRNKPHTLGYCASGRLVKEEDLKGKVPGLYRAITDERGPFTYMAYLTGDYLDGRVSAERVSFGIPEKTEGLLEGTEPSFSDIREAVYPRITKYLEVSLKEVIAEGKERVEKFVSDRAPKYRPLLRHMPEGELLVDPKMSESDLEFHLHKATFKVEREILREGHELLSQETDFGDYDERLKNYMNKVTDLKQADLANYVTNRWVVIDLLERGIRRQEDGKFVREEIIHELIAPMGTSSTDERYKRQNLWLIDERLTFHHHLASDVPLKSNPTTTSASGKEPDISALRVFQSPLLVGDREPPRASITVIEIKRPMREGFRAGEGESEDPILQSLEYLRCLREGTREVNGRLIPNAERIPGFVYVVADLTKSLVKCCKVHQLQITPDGMGYFGYQRDESYNAYIQVMSFDGLVASAKERNRAFFDRLGLPAA